MAVDFEALERWWREEADAPVPRLEEATLMKMIEGRAAGVRRDVRRRLRREAGYYLPVLAVSQAGLLAGFAPERLLAAGSVLVLIGGVMATLWHAERRIEDSPLDRSLRDAVRGLLAQVDAAGRVYLAAYVLVFVLAAAAATTTVGWRHGFGWGLAGTLAGSVLAVAWSWRSGRAYVDRMFRRYRGELRDCLGQLEE